jgi:BON domain-containing protein
MNFRILRMKNLAPVVLTASVLGIFATLSGCASAPTCATPAACADEAGMADKISAALRSAPGIEFNEVHVQYRNGVVYLYGLVATRPERTEIERIASESSGGKKVVNSIEVRGRY